MSPECQGGSGLEASPQHSLSQEKTAEGLQGVGSEGQWGSGPFLPMGLWTFPAHQPRALGPSQLQQSCSSAGCLQPRAAQEKGRAGGAGHGAGWRVGLLGSLLWPEPLQPSLLFPSGRFQLVAYI